MDAETMICFPKFTSKEATSLLERCGGAMYFEHHKWLTSRCGGSMLTQRHTRPHPKMRRHTTYRCHKRLTLFSRELATKAYSRSTMGHLRAVTEPVQGWGNLHNSIGVSQQQCHKGYKATKGNKATKGYKTTRGQQSNHRPV